MAPGGAVQDELWVVVDPLSVNFGLTIDVDARDDPGLYSLQVVAGHPTFCCRCSSSAAASFCNDAGQRIQGLLSGAATGGAATGPIAERSVDSLREKL